MLEKRIKKARAYTEHLLDEVIHLRTKYAMPEPLIFDKGVASRWGHGARARGFLTLRTVLLYSCSQDVAKIACDRDKRAPSISNLVAALRDEALRARLREDYAVIRYHFDDEDLANRTLLEYSPIWRNVKPQLGGSSLTRCTVNCCTSGRR